MIAQEHLEEIKKALDSAKSIFVLIPGNPSLDTTAAGLGLYLALKETGKSVVIGCPTKMRVEYNRLVGIDQISDKVGNRNLTIAFDYKEDSIEKVSYNVDAGKFNLVIQPKSGYPPLDTKSVEFSYEGIQAEVIVVIGAQRLEGLGELYEKEREAFNKAAVINIDKSQANTKFGQVNVVESSQGSICELIFNLIKQLGLRMDVDIAGNLLKGIEAQTQNFQAPFAGPETFETVAELLRSGARRTQPMPASRPWVQGGIPAFSQDRSDQGRFVPQGKGPVPQAPPGIAPTSLAEPELNLSDISTPSSILPEPTRDTGDQSRQFRQPITQTTHGEGATRNPQPGTPGIQGIKDGRSWQSVKPQPDWLNKPKIYKGSSKVD
ncbi:MAG: hypothetical protein A2900_01460 [Candidatus Chisholmbacteria bacterium RIFCSPLOWO2_01_FULL_50_28]|uniref:DDH domain-containing protein n=1 Tax=Candidatus Chisholmbacteria bacterium RIFCSPHIGHO2_01_FULL_52_32 TaxID=1797591 RepID=A0A1G1VU20_9BACT|nr:MAG: hypothetical protein A2786_05280 [Candidatus Chisholmbacteria bacterium RIFCSPHIGHO2_01_FULL_52_32]OGY19757.1 MAG: hypothetical protein A2900_01460 [Candidatus Chisholmbacteria bacterium RIFCSPLOWO2_01_FULL_50_28]